MSIENNNICNAVNCVSCVLKDFSDNQVGVITPNALECCTGLPVSCCVLPANDLNDWYNFALPPFSRGTDKMLFHRCDSCFYYPMCFYSPWGYYMLDKTCCIQNGQVYCIDRDTSISLQLKYNNSTWYIGPSAYEWWLWCEGANKCTIVVYAPSVCSNSAFTIGSICAWYGNYYYVTSAGPVNISEISNIYRHNSIGDKVCLL